MHYESIYNLGRAIRDKDVSPVEIARHTIRRIEEYDPAYRAHISFNPDRLVENAKLAEREIGEGLYRGPLHGIPIGLKDNIYTSFARTTFGSSIHKDFTPDFNATVVNRLGHAGANISSKFKTTEYAWSSHHSDYGPPVNPWNKERWAGASSSGSGVAVATGMAFGALGTDTGGSIRNPAAANGIVSLKPTWGRVSRHGVFPLAYSFDAVGPMARSVVDVALIFEAIAGWDADDLTTSRSLVESVVAGIGGGVAGLKIGLPRPYILDGVDPLVVAAVEAAAEVLARLGASIREVSMPDHRPALDAHASIMAAEAAHAHRETFPEREGDYTRDLGEYLRRVSGRAASDAAYAHIVKHEYTNRLDDLFESVDLMIIPTFPTPTPSIAEWDALAGGGFEPFLRFTQPFSLTGHPTLTMPSGLDSEGTPLSLQMVSGRFRETTLFRAGAAFQTATAWHLRRPVP
ncbi:amidase [Chelativorans sp. Marseille-P2723]|uniref:amidase n=1 Tax=Chelativorans sp. Marseille-P2723 TaxID=2709133 RepID=UPI0015709801|nr:amidase [Chelativorans sp. Marseille-P2723]